MSLKPKSATLWFAVPLLAMNLIACGDDEEVPTPVPTKPELCGNNKVDEGEDCDDGNLNPQDGCLPNCTKAQCGDGTWYVPGWREVVFTSKPCGSALATDEDR